MSRRLMGHTWFRVVRRGSLSRLHRSVEAYKVGQMSARQSSLQQTEFWLRSEFRCPLGRLGTQFRSSFRGGNERSVLQGRENRSLTRCLHPHWRAISFSQTRRSSAFLAY